MPSAKLTKAQQIEKMVAAAVSAGDNEGFLAHCTDDIRWTTVGEGTRPSAAPGKKAKKARTTMRCKALPGVTGAMVADASAAAPVPVAPAEPAHGPSAAH